MEADDIIYLSVLLFVIVFGLYFRRIYDIKKKKWISTALGFSIVFLTSGIHVIHSIVLLFVNSVIIVKTDNRYCHIKSFAFSFLYLIFFRSISFFGISHPPMHTNLILMVMTLKVVGVACEVHDSHSKQEKPSYKLLKEIKLNFSEVFHYCYCHIGVLTGPYFSYKTYNDYYKYDFYKYANCEMVAIKKLCLVPIYAIVYFITSHYFPVKNAETDEFYSKTNFWFRLWYITPVFVSFRMRMYVGLILSEVACITAGFGAYPEPMKPVCGEGPTTNFEFLDKEKTKLKTTKFNFDTIRNISVWHTETDLTVRTSISYWNMTVQHWMVYTVYKRIPRKYKFLRTGATFTVSALWHGVYGGYYLCLCAVPFYLYVEDLWVSVLKACNYYGWKKNITNFIFWIARTQAFSYMGMAFSLLSMTKGLRFYASVYFTYHITTIMIGLPLGLFLKNKINKSITSK